MTPRLVTDPDELLTGLLVIVVSAITGLFIINSAVKT